MSTYFEFVAGTEVVAVECATGRGTGRNIRELDKGNVGLAGDGLNVDIARISVALRPGETDAWSTELSVAAAQALQARMVGENKIRTQRTGSRARLCPLPRGCFAGRASCWAADTRLASPAAFACSRLPLLARQSLPPLPSLRGSSSLAPSSAIHSPFLPSSYAPASAPCAV